MDSLRPRGRTGISAAIVALVVLGLSIPATSTATSGTQGTRSAPYDFGFVYVGTVGSDYRPSTLVRDTGILSRGRTIFPGPAVESSLGIDLPSMDTVNASADFTVLAQEGVMVGFCAFTAPPLYDPPSTEVGGCDEAALYGLPEHGETFTLTISNFNPEQRVIGLRVFTWYPAWATAASVRVDSISWRP